MSNDLLQIDGTPAGGRSRPARPPWLRVRLSSDPAVAETRDDPNLPLVLLHPLLEGIRANAELIGLAESIGVVLPSRP